jgi:hypothetical protein
MSAEYQRDPAYREPIQEREVIVTDRDRGPGGLIALLVGIAAVVLIVWLVVSNLGAVTGDGGTTVDVPDQIDVNVNDGQG